MGTQYHWGGGKNTCIKAPTPFYETLWCVCATIKLGNAVACLLTCKHYIGQNLARKEDEIINNVSGPCRYFSINSTPHHPVFCSSDV